MPDYAALRTLAQRLISESGRTLTLVKRDLTPTNGSKPWRGSSSDIDDATETSVIGVFVPGEDNIQEAGQSNRRKLNRFYVAGQATDLTDYHQIKDGTNIWRIVKNTVLQPGDTTLLYEIEVVK